MCNFPIHYKGRIIYVTFTEYFLTLIIWVRRHAILNLINQPIMTKSFHAAWWNLAILKWRHNWRDGVSNHQSYIVDSTVYSWADQSKHQSSASLAFVWVIHRGPVNSPHKCPVTRKMIPFHDVIMGSCLDWSRIYIYLDSNVHLRGT